MINGKAATNTINMWKLTKEYWKDMWVLLWSKTTVDDIVIAKACLLYTSDAADE